MKRRRLILVFGHLNNEMGSLVYINIIERIQHEAVSRTIGSPQKLLDNKDLHRIAGNVDYTEGQTTIAQNSRAKRVRRGILKSLASNSRRNSGGLCHTNLITVGIASVQSFEQSIQHIIDYTLLDQITRWDRLCRKHMGSAIKIHSVFQQSCFILYALFTLGYRTIVRYCLFNLQVSRRLCIVCRSRHVSSPSSPVDMNVLAFRVVGARVFRLDAESVGTEVVTLRLEKVGW